MAASRIRVVTTEDGFRGRKAGTAFDLTAAEFSAGGPFEAAGAGGDAPEVTAAAALEADRLGIDLSRVRPGEAGRVTIREVRAASAPD